MSVEVANRAEKPLAEGLVVGIDGMSQTDPAQILADLGRSTAACILIAREIGCQ